MNIGYRRYWIHILLCLLCGEGILQIPREGVIAADRGGGTGILLLSEIETKYLYLYFYRPQVWSLPCLVKQLPCWFLFKLLFFLRFVFNRFVFKFRCAFCLILSLQSPNPAYQDLTLLFVFVIDFVFIFVFVSKREKTKNGSRLHDIIFLLVLSFVPV